MPDKANDVFYNGRVKCIKAAHYSPFTEGKIYEFRDGSTKADDGFTFPNMFRVGSFKEWQRGTKNNSFWEEIEELEEK